MKKLLSLLMVAAMLFTTAFAATAPLTEAEFFALPVSSTIPAEANFDLITDIELKNDASTDYENGPLTIWKTDLLTQKVFAFKASVDMQNVRDAYAKLYDHSLAKLAELGISEPSRDAFLANIPVTGQFIVKVILPAGITIPDADKTGTNMYGFSGTDLSAYVETVARTYAADTLTITVDLAPTLTIGQLKANPDMLCDLALECTAVSVPTIPAGTYTIKGEIDGWLQSTFNAITTKINFTELQKADTATDKYQDPTSAAGVVSGTVNVAVPATGGSTPTPVKPGDKTITVTYDIPEIPAESGANKVTIDFDKKEKPMKDGKIFEGFYLDEEKTKPATGTLEFIEDTMIYTKWTDVTAVFAEDHLAYIIGYPDGTVRSEDEISREEVATVFYRLLRIDKQIAIAATENNFSDVAADSWSNKAISSMANGGYINGYEDGTFRPEDSITRAELVKIIANIYNLGSMPASIFADIEGHWAAGTIGAVTAKEWIKGYEDGTFRPDQYITRAEVMTIVNRMLNRKVDADGVCEGTTFWKDLEEGAWYYYDVIEATNAHEYERADIADAETWTKVAPNNVWAEKAEFEDAE